MRPRYGIDPRAAVTPAAGRPGATADLDAVVAAAAVVVGAWSPRLPVLGIAVGAMSLMLVAWRHIARRPAWTLIAAAVLAAGGGGLGAWRADVAWQQLRPDRLGEYTGWASIVGDPAPRGSAWRVIVELDGERFEIIEYGRAAGQRLARWEVGSRVLVAGTRRAHHSELARRLAPAHIVGELELEWASDVATASPLNRVTNRVRTALGRAASRLGAPRDSLFLGLVVGDDRAQPASMRERFRASGLVHLMAVSGQNVAFVVAAAGPLLRRMRPWWRWAATCTLIAWFVVLTRFEPSVLRAGLMAGLAATAFVRGRQQHPLRLVAVAVGLLVLVDPLLVWSVGFWLSVGATIGVTCVGPWLASRLTGWGVLATPLGYTLGAQVGVAIPLLLVFGELPLMSVPANVLAIPVAGVVMLYGLPAGLVAANAPLLAPALMVPIEIGVRWIDTVAFVASELEPSGPLAGVGWLTLATGVAYAVSGRRGRESAFERPSKRSQM